MTATFDLYNAPLPPGVHSIEASAGTGKTYTLAQLVVRLIVEEGLPIEQILVLTFTRAAAAELRERIFQRLGEVERILQAPASSTDQKLRTWLQKQDAEQARTALLRAKMMLDQAAIYTIDSFAMQTMREHALALGLPWDATLLDDPQTLDQALVDQCWHSLDTLDDDALRTEILRSWRDPDTLYKRFKALGEGAEFDSPDSLSALQQKQVRILARWTPERLQALGQAVADQLYAACAPKKKGWCNRQVLTPLKNGALPQIKEPLEHYLQSRLEEAGHSLQDVLPPDLLQELLALSQDLAALPTLTDFVQAWFRDQYTRWQTERQQELDRRGVFTYHSLKHRLAERVEADADLRTALQQRYQACLIDEFQDTDPDQWRLFRTLFGNSDTHRLFLIGDPKQAIYAFRGANLETYFAATATAQHRHTLATNYRSHPTLIDGFNALFQETPDWPPAFMDPRCTYQPVEAGRAAEDTAFTLADEPAERIRIIIGEGLNDVEQATLQQLARDVVAALEQGTLQGTPLRPGDIAILAKSNSDAAAIQQMLRKVNVPSVLTSRDSVWQSDSAADLLRVLEALLTPTRSERVRTALIGPYFQLTLGQLDEPARYAAMQRAFDDAHTRWHREGLLAALLQLFHEADTWPRLARLPDGDRRIADTRHLLELLHEEGQLNRRGPQALLRWALQQHHGAHNEAVLRLERDDDAVEIVTMHSAKGLQYPVVFVYGAWKGDAVNSKAYPIGIPTPDGVRATFDKGEKATLKAQEQQQLRRLFYVACTRAESHLTLYWPNPSRPEADQPWVPDNALDGILAPREAALRNHDAFTFIDGYTGTPLTRWTPPSTSATLEAPPAPDFAALRRNSRQLTSYSALTRSHGDESPRARWLDEGPSVPVEDALPAGPVFGQLVHDFLEQTDFRQPDWSRLETLWQRHGFSGAMPPALRTLVHNTLHGVCDPFRLADLPPQHTWREHHFVLHTPQIDTAALDRLFGDRPDWVPLPSRDLRGYLQGYIDLIAEHDGRYYLLDYKTNRLAAYDRDSLAAAMAEHHYTLQALIYTLALDAHLRITLPDYDPARHLGGVRYLFVRGMQPQRPSGVYALEFTPEMLEKARNALKIGENAP